MRALTRVHAAACDAVALFASDDALRAAVLDSPSERAALEQAVTQLTRATWDEAEDPSYVWVAVCERASRGACIARVSVST